MISASIHTARDLGYIVVIMANARRAATAESDLVGGLANIGYAAVKRSEGSSWIFVEVDRATLNALEPKTRETCWVTLREEIDKLVEPPATSA